MDESGNLPIIFIIIGNMGAALIQNFLEPLLPAICTPPGAICLTSGTIYWVSLAFYFAPIPIIILHGWIAEKNAGGMKISVGTVWSPKFPNGVQLKQEIMQFKWRSHTTEELPGTDDNITHVDLVEPTPHPYYGNIWRAHFIHKGTFVGDNLKLGEGNVQHMGETVHHASTDKLVLYESAYVQESKFVRSPVYKIKHAPAMYEQEVAESLEELGKIQGVEQLVFA